MRGIWSDSGLRFGHLQPSPPVHTLEIHCFKNFDTILYRLRLKVSKTSPSNVYELQWKWSYFGAVRLTKPKKRFELSSIRSTEHVRLEFSLFLTVLTPTTTFLPQTIPIVEGKFSLNKPDNVQRTRDLSNASRSSKL